MKRLIPLLLTLVLLCYAFDAAQAESPKLVNLLDAQPGDLVTFGHYAQDDWTSSQGAQPAIEWVVLDRSPNGQLLLLSYKAIAVHNYHKWPQKLVRTTTSVVWADSYLREWLNSTFMNRAFTQREQNMMLATEVPGEKNPFYPRTAGGRSVKDKVWILSASEYERYVQGTPWSVTCLTADAHKALTSDSSAQYQRGLSECWWWLRNPGSDNTRAQIVSFDGKISESGHMPVTTWHGGVRPVICVNLGR